MTSPPKTNGKSRALTTTEPEHPPTNITNLQLPTSKKAPCLLASDNHINTIFPIKLLACDPFAKLDLLVLLAVVESQGNGASVRIGKARSFAAEQPLALDDVNDGRGNELFPRRIASLNPFQDIFCVDREVVSIEMADAFDITIFNQVRV
jgi:hypothetical protein